MRTMIARALIAGKTTKMTAKQYLLRAYKLKRHIRDKEIQLEELRTQAEHITATLTGMPHGPGVSAPVEKLAIKIADATWELEQEYLDLLFYQDETEKAIRLLQDPTLESLMVYRYVYFYQWERIQELLHYSARHTFTLHKKALRILDQKLAGKLQDSI